MPDYSNGKIYKIHSYQTDLVYYGSTTDTLCRRFSGHKTSMNLGRSVSSRQILKYDDAMITLIELFSCDSKSELESRERFYIENNQCVNKIIPTRTINEWNIANKDKEKIRHTKYYQEHKDKAKQYQQKNKEKIKAFKKQYYQTNKEKIHQYLQQNKEKISENKKQYHNNNKDSCNERSKQYKQKNKEYLIQYDYWRRVNPIGILARAYF